MIKIGLNALASAPHQTQANYVKNILTHSRKKSSEIGFRTFLPKALKNMAVVANLLLPEPVQLIFHL
jgi:hypothetical protein